MKILSIALYGRPSDRSPFGKRTTRIQFSTPELIEICLQKEAKFLGVRPERLVEAVIVARYTSVSSSVDGHQQIMHLVTRAGNDNK